jgi:prephenate dehydrogenase
MTIGVLGTGLIGASLGMALKAKGHHVLGWDISEENLAVAKRRHCIDEAPAFEEVAKADIVFVCVPPNSVVATLESVYKFKLPGTIVSDCTSIKAEISSWAEAKGASDFVPGHPMAGHEKSGPSFASAWMFRGAKWILTPTKVTDKKALKAVEDLLKEIETKPFRLEASDHDCHVGVLSHLPHVLAGLLIEMGSELENSDAGGGSWRDLTRVGGVDPNLWAQILIGNRTEMAKILDTFASRLSEISNDLRAGDALATSDWLNKIVELKPKEVKK